MTLQFVTPAFIGGAETASELRTPPFKALLRRWWRIVEVAGRKPDVPTLREREGMLFGHAWLKHKSDPWSLKSRVRLAIDDWMEGSVTSWRVADPGVKHPEVDRPSIGSHLYLGYGPLTVEKGRTSLNSKTRTSALAADTAFDLVIHALADRWDELNLDDVLTMWTWFGTIGSRSRNGWGSLEIVNHAAPGNLEALKRFSRCFIDCFDSDWPHAIGCDKQGLLVWRTKEDYPKWEEAVEALAKAKIKVRTSFPFRNNRDIKNPVVEERHVLAYPVTNHGVLGWSERGPSGQPVLDKHGKLKQTSRLANQLWLKIRRRPGQVPRYEGVVVHLPHRLPEAMLRELSSTEAVAVRGQEREIWKRVHEILDKELERCR